MRCELKSHFLTISNGLGLQIDPVFLTKRGWNTQRSFRLFLDKKKNRAGNENGLKRIICSACSTVPKRTTRYPMLLVKSNDNDAWWSGKVKWPPPRQYQRRSLTIVRITRTSRTAVARLRSSSMSITITPTITITNEKMKITTDLTLVVIFSPNYPTAHQGQSLWRPYWPGATSKHFDKSDKLGLAWLLTSY